MNEGANNYNRGLVSVIMPAYNAAQHIAESIESVLMQTYPHWELLVVDDGSTDNTAEVIRHYTFLDPRIRYLYQQHGRQGRARNRGIAQSTGSYLAFLDSDDLWLPDKLITQLEFIQGCKADLVFSDAYIFESVAELAQKAKTMQASFGVFAGMPGLDAFLSCNRIPILTVLCRRNAIETVGGFSENYLVQNAEDYQLWLKLLLSGYQFHGMDATLAAYRVRNTSVSSTNRLNLREVVEAKAELRTSYPNYQTHLTASIERTIIYALPYTAALPANEFFFALDRFLRISGRAMLRPLFAALEKVNARATALRTAYFAFNYL